MLITKFRVRSPQAATDVRAVKTKAMAKTKKYIRDLDFIIFILTYLLSQFFKLLSRFFKLKPRLKIRAISRHILRYIFHLGLAFFEKKGSSTKLTYPQLRLKGAILRT
jgi:hypothetical protein